MDERDEKYIHSLIIRDTAKEVKWKHDKYIGRICPTCGHESWYCSVKEGYALKQPDNFCSKCGQRFVIE